MAAPRLHALFGELCVRCHAVNREGGRVGPDLNVPQSITEYRPEAQIRAYIRNPLTFRYGAMPAHPHLSDGDLDDLVVALLAALPALALAACGDGGTTSPGFTDHQVIADFADRVVIPTYALLDERAAALHDAALALRAAPTPANLTAAQAAWVATRVPWEQSEGFLFGPVSAQGFDPAMDSWPVDRTDLEAVIASSDPLTATYIRNLPETQKGFHAIEYLVFGEARDRVATDPQAAARVR